VSKIIDAIKRIAVIAKQNNFTNLPGNLIYEHCYVTLQDVTPDALTQEHLKLVDEYLDGYQPRLTLDKIEETIENYCFKLPQEIYDLYLMGNGCLPIGILEEDFDSIYNYFSFPSSECPLLTLREAK
jgi:hypothetical protein